MEEPHAYTPVAHEGRCDKCKQRTANCLDDGRLVLGQTVLQDVLNDIVSILILSQFERVRVNLLQDRDRLLEFAVLQQTLDHATGIAVRAQLTHFADAFVHDEL